MWLCTYCFIITLCLCHNYHQMATKSTHKCSYNSAVTLTSQLQSHIMNCLCLNNAWNQYQIMNWIAIPTITNKGSLWLGDNRWMLWYLDDIWWRHQMKTFSTFLALCADNLAVTGEFPSQRPATRSFGFFHDLRLNKRLSKQSWGGWFETPLLWADICYF